MGLGGKRAGAGRKKGFKLASTLTKEQAREALRLKVTAEMHVLADAMIAAVKGINHFFLRDAKTQQFARITDPEQIQASLNAGKEHYWIHTKDPSVEAFKALADRALDKPAEHLKIAGEDGPIEVKWKS